MNLSGISTQNIEIVGATHFDYTVRGPSSPTPPDDWNRTVAGFATDLIRASDPTKLNQFFIDHQNVMFHDLQRDVWVVKLPGWDQHQ